MVSIGLHDFTGQMFDATEMEEHVSLLYMLDRLMKFYIIKLQKLRFSLTGSITTL